MDTNKSRRDVLLSLTNFNRPLAAIRDDLSAYPWDSKESVVTLTREHVRSVLNRFLKGEISAAELEEWANMIEGREDVNFEGVAEEYIKDIIFELANPALTIHPDPDNVRKLIFQLDQ